MISPSRFAVDIDHAPYAGLKLNPALDLESLAAEFERNGHYIRIPDILVPESAELVYRTLLTRTAWGLAYYDGEAKFLRRDELEALAPEDLAGINRHIMRTARDSYQYVYNCYPIFKAMQEGWDPGHLLMRFLEFINSDVMVEMIRAITGEMRITMADGQATSYAPKHFLVQHNDKFDEDYWRLAYVFGFSRNWRPDWGGYLQFFDSEDRIERALMPRYNVLNIFKVPRKHAVGLVAPFAGAPRLSITGWFRDK